MAKLDYGLYIWQYGIKVKYSEFGNYKETDCTCSQEVKIELFRERRYSVCNFLSNEQTVIIILIIYINRGC